MKRFGRALQLCAGIFGVSSLSCAGERGEGAANQLAIFREVPSEEMPEFDHTGASEKEEPARIERRCVGRTCGDGHVRWCSSGGAPVVGEPVIDERGRAYVATSDGYLHAFERDGRYRWSYTVQGTPLGSVSLRPSDGVILMGTTGRYVYAINQSGTLHWSFRTVTPVWSGLYALNPSTVVFVGLDQRLYALANTGSARYRVKAPSSPMGGPVVGRNDVVWVPLSDGVARFHAAYRLEKFDLPSASEQLVVLGDAAVVRAGGRAYRIASNQDPQDLGHAENLAAFGERLLLVESERSARLIGGGEKTRRLKIDGEKSLSASPTLARENLWLSFSDGTVGVQSLTGGETRTIHVGDSPLASVVLESGEAGGIVTDTRGTFCSVTLHEEGKR